jgi:hypothetical protein
MDAYHKLSAEFGSKNRKTESRQRKSYLRMAVRKEVDAETAPEYRLLPQHILDRHEDIRQDFIFDGMLTGNPPNLEALNAYLLENPLARHFACLDAAFGVIDEDIEEPDFLGSEWDF